MSDKQLHPIPKRSNIEIVPGSIKKVGIGKWTFKWKEAGNSVTHNKTINTAVKGDNNFEFKWV